MNVSRLWVLYTALTGIASCFLPWVTKRALYPTIESKAFTTYSGLAQGDAFGQLILCIVACAVVLIGKRKISLNYIKRWTIAVCGLFVLGNLASSIKFMKESNTFNASISINLESRPEIGCFFGALVGVLLFLIPLVISEKKSIREFS